MTKINIVDGRNHLDEIVKLFAEYKQEVKVDMSFQPADDTDEEILKRYAEPLGKIYTAIVDDKAAGCIAFHPMDDKCNCELKRLYVRSSFRGLHIGRILMDHAIAEAKTLGYNAIYLDTLSTLKAACNMYESLGFEQIDPYYYNPLPNVLYYRLNLKTS